MSLSKLFGHFNTITRHRHLVCKYCFRLGLYRQGLLHDLSKYSLTEFVPGVKYYSGTHSPNEPERLEKGYSAAWLHHKGRNKHHLEYWIDFDITFKEKMAGMVMPKNYVAEMFCDRVAASQIYMKDRYTDSAPLDYYYRSLPHYIIHPEVAKTLEDFFLHLKETGLDSTLQYIKKDYLGK